MPVIAGVFAATMANHALAAWAGSALASVFMSDTFRIAVAIGFILMAGGKSDDPTVFNPEVFSTRRITIAPIVVLLGFIIEGFAIMWKPKNKSN